MNRTLDSFIYLESLLVVIGDRRARALSPKVIAAPVCRLFPRVLSRGNTDREQPKPQPMKTNKHRSACLPFVVAFLYIDPVRS